MIFFTFYDFFSGEHYGTLSAVQTVWSATKLLEMRDADGWRTNTDPPPWYEDTQHEIITVLNNKGYREFLAEFRVALRNVHE